MFVEFKGGPCDGERVYLARDPLRSYFLIANQHPERPIYRCSVCQCCLGKMVLLNECIEYYFIGYESQFQKTDATAATGNA